MNYKKLHDTPLSTPHSGINIQIGQASPMYTYSTQGSIQNLGEYQQGTAAYPQFNDYPQSAHHQHGAYTGGYGQQQQQNAAAKYVYESQAYKEDYFKKQIENSLIKRTDVTGSISHGYTEFDDYFGKHVDKFFTPEIDELYIYYHEGYVFGLQAIYRDSWGKTNKETYKGELHMASNVTKENCQRLKMKLTYDEYIKEAYVEAGEYVTFLKFVTNNKQTIQIGHQQGTPKNIVPDQSKIMGIGGTHNICLNSIYFYYT